MHKPRPGRLPTFSYLGLHRYFLTICTRAKQPVFTDADVVERTLWHFRQRAAAESFQILAYCFMPDHLHLLVEGRSSSSDFQRFVRDAKQGSGYAHSRLFGQRLWQDGYYDHVLRDDEATLTVIRYILENPVRAGLVDEFTKYPFLGSDLYTMQELLPAWDTQG